MTYIIRAFKILEYSKNEVLSKTKENSAVYVKQTRYFKYAKCFTSLTYKVPAYEDFASGASGERIEFDAASFMELRESEY